MPGVKIIQPAYPAPAGTLIERPLGSVIYLAIHHSAGPPDQDILAIDAFERSRGDSFMPYAGLVNGAGDCFAGRDPKYVSAATFGVNPSSVAICLLGNFMEAQPSQAQWDSLVAYCIWMHRQIPTIQHTDSHRYFGLKYGGYYDDCCGNLLVERMPELRAAILKGMAHGA
jgi:hypothetical protein